MSNDATAVLAAVVGSLSPSTLLGVVIDVRMVKQPSNLQTCLGELANLAMIELIGPEAAAFATQAAHKMALLEQAQADDEVAAIKAALRSN